MKKHPVYKLANLDKLVHEPERFIILNALENGQDSEWFRGSHLRRITGLTHSQQAAHLRVLKDAGLVENQKADLTGGIENRKADLTGRKFPLWRITSEGRKAVEEHWRLLRGLREEAGAWEPTQVFHGYEIPPGYEPAEEAARRAGRNFEVLKRMCRNGRIPGAYKIGGPGGYWVVPERFRVLPTDEKPRTGEERGQEVARRAHAGESKAALAREYGINRGTVYNLMERYPDEAPGPAHAGPGAPREEDE